MTLSLQCVSFLTGLFAATQVSPLIHFPYCSDISIAHSATFRVKCNLVTWHQWSPGLALPTSWVSSFYSLHPRPLLASRRTKLLLPLFMLLPLSRISVFSSPPTPATHCLVNMYRLFRILLKFTCRKPCLMAYQPDPQIDKEVLSPDLLAQNTETFIFMADASQQPCEADTALQLQCSHVGMEPRPL